jgi:hypothetical protein
VKAQYTLTLDRPGDFFNIAFEADSVQIMNYTPYELYLRVGDNWPQAGPLAWHHRVPPGTAATIPASARYFSASINVPKVINLLGDNVDQDASRVDLIFMRDETPQALTQLNSPAQYGQVWK